MATPSFALVMKRFSDACDYQSFREIIASSANSNFNEPKKTYKVLNKDTGEQPIICGSSIAETRNKALLNSEFLTIKVRKRKYQRKDCFIIYIDKVTKKMRNKAIYIREQEIIR